MKNLIFLIFFILSVSCSPKKSENSNSSGTESTNEETGATIYFPEGGGDGEIEEGEDVANDTTGAYLTIPMGIEEASKSVNVSLKKYVKLDVVESWELKIKLSKDMRKYIGSNPKRIGVFYHVTRDKKNFYGVVVYDPASNDSLRFIDDDSVRFALRGTGNYQVGLVPEDLKEREMVESSDLILTEATSFSFVKSTFVNGNYQYAGMKNHKLYLSDGGVFQPVGEDSSFVAQGVNNFTKHPTTSVLYLATGLGVAKSDDNGESFETFSSEYISKLNSRQLKVNAIAIQSDFPYRVYVATDAGVAILSSTKMEYENDAFHVPKDGNESIELIKDIAVTSGGDIYVATKMGAFFSTNQGLSFSRVVTGDDSKTADLAGEIFSLAVDSKQRIAFGLANGLVYWDSVRGRSQKVREIDGFHLIPATDVYIDNSDTIYIVGTGGYASIKYSHCNMELEPLSKNSPLKNKKDLSPTGIFVDSGNVYISSREGLLDSLGVVIPEFEDRD